MGTVHAVAVQSGHAYCATSGGLVILDVREVHESPASRVDLDPAGTLETNRGVDILVSGPRVYLAVARDELLVIDAGDPARPRLEGATPLQGAEPSPSLFRISLAGSHVVSVLRGALEVIDASDPARPRPVALHSEPGAFFTDVFVHGNHAYVSESNANDLGGLRVFDVRDPPRPRQVGRLDLGRHAQPTAVFVAGEHAYLPSHHGGLVVVDVADPAAPRRVGDGYGAGLAGPIFVEDGRAYLTGNILDVTDPARPRPAGPFDRPASRDREFLEDIFVAGGLAFVADETAGLRVLDVRDPPEPSWVGGVEFDSLLGHFESIVIDGDHAYSGRYVIDFGDPAHPRLASVFPKSVVGEISLVRVLAVSAGHAYVSGMGGLSVFDVTSPSDPAHVGEIPGIESPQGAHIEGSLAYVLAAGDLVIVDVSDPALPRTVGRAAIRGADVFVSGSRAYVAEAGHLDIVDVSDPARPRRVGSYGGDGSVGSRWGGVAVRGDHAYLSNGGGLLLVIDVSDPARPRLAGTYVSPQEGGASDVVLSGDFAYLTQDRGLHVIDVSDPARPVRVARYRTSLPAGAVAISENLAFVAAGDLEILDLRVRPASLPVAGVFEVPPIAGLFVEGSTGYAGDGGRGLQVFDLADPANPRRVGRHESARSESRFLRAVAAGGIVYALDAPPRGAAILETIDAGDPGDPRPLGAYTARNLRGDFFERVGFTADRFAVAGGYAYLAHSVYSDRGEWETHLEVIDVRDAALPREAGGYSTSGWSAGVAVSGNHAYLAAGDDDLRGYELVDVSDPAAPRLLRRFGDSAPGVPVISGPRAYVLYERFDEVRQARESGFEILDITDPVNPRALGRHAGAGEVKFVSDGIAYLHVTGGLDHGVHLVDVSDPIAPVLTGRYPPARFEFAARGIVYGGAAGFAPGLVVIDATRRADPQRVGIREVRVTAERGGIFISGERAHVAAGESGLEIFDASDPARIRRLGVHDTSETAEGVFVTEPFAFLADGRGGLAVIDVRDPASPRRLGGTEIPGFEGQRGYGYDVCLEGGHALLACWTSPGDGSLEVIDVGDPARPSRRGSAATGHVAFRVAAGGGHAYVLTAAAELEVIDVRDPDRPRRVAALPGGYSFHGSDVEVEGDRAYVTSWNTLQVLDIGDPSRPRVLGEHRGYDIFTTVAVSGEVAFVSGTTGLEAIDCNRPEAMRRLGGNSTVQGIGLAASGRRIFALERERLVVLELERPFPPVDLLARAGEGAVELSWSPRTGGLPAAAYQVYRTSPGPRVKLNASSVTGTSFTASGLAAGFEHCFAVRALSVTSAESEDSAGACAVPLGAVAHFLRGDCDGDGLARGRVTDAVFLLEYNFRGGPKPPCLAACDADGDGRTEGQVTDAIYLLNHNFLGGPAPPPPFPECGPWTLESDATLGCETPSGCP
jgi:hypothetical protein